MFLEKPQINPKTNYLLFHFDLPDLMMVVGGSDGAQSLVSTEIYNPATETWTLGPALTGE